MKYPRNQLELLLNRVELSHPALSRDQGSFGVRIRLVAPRPNIATRDTLLFLDVKQGNTKYQKKPYSERVLFKQTVEGRFGLAIEFSRATSKDSLISIFRRLMSTALERTSAEGLAIWAPNLPMLTRPAARFFGDLVDLDDAPEVMARADLDMTSLPMDEEIALPVKIVETTRLETVRGATKLSAAHRKRTRATYRKKETLGTIYLQSLIS